MNQQLVLLTLRSKKKGRKFETRSKPTVELPTAPPWPIQRSSLTLCLTPFTRAPLATFSHFIPHTKEWAGGLPTNMSVQQWSWNFVDKRCCFFPVTVENLLHRSYPRSLRGTRKAWQEFIQIIQRGAPAKYVNQSLFHEFRKDPFDYLETSKTYCRNETRHQPIVPFAHFDEQSQKEVS